MAKRKDKGKSTGKIHQPKGSTEVTKQQPANKFIPLVVIGIAALALIIYLAASLSSSPKQGVAQTGQNTVDTSLAAPMTGTEDFSAGQIDASKAKVTTFKMEELAGTDCVQTIMAEFVKLGGIGNLKADYSNKLLEVQYDPTKVTVPKIIDALVKGQHPGIVTSEKIVPKKAPVYVGGSIVEPSTDSAASTGTGTTDTDSKK